MNRHRLDPLSLILGTMVIGLSIAVTLGPPDDLRFGDPLWWIATPALLVGVAIIPWQRTAPTPDRSEGDAEVQLN